jgi:prepilin-type N-terminal cleavage/methylation domain-containing protein
MKRGFTLIELLVVIAVIGILAAVIISSVNSARSKARNTQRNSDIKQLVNAFNLGLDSSGGVFPDSAAQTNWRCVSATCYGGYGSYPNLAEVDAFLAPYIQKPSDPTAGGRIVGGYLYFGNIPGLNGYSGFFEAGSYLLWALEPPLQSNSCSPGRVFDVQPSYIQCHLKL